MFKAVRFPPPKGPFIYVCVRTQVFSQHRYPVRLPSSQNQALFDLRQVTSKLRLMDDGVKQDLLDRLAMKTRRNKQYKKISTVPST